MKSSCSDMVLLSSLFLGVICLRVCSLGSAMVAKVEDVEFL
jgi:hypothetical protein